MSFVTFLLLFCYLFLSPSVCFSWFACFWFLFFFSLSISLTPSSILNSRCNCVPFIKICEECLSHNRTKPEPHDEQSGWFFNYCVAVCVVSDFLGMAAFCAALSHLAYLDSIGLEDSNEMHLIGFHAFTKFLIISCIMLKILIFRLRILWIWFFHFRFSSVSLASICFIRFICPMQVRLIIGFI